MFKIGTEINKSDKEIKNLSELIKSKFKSRFRLSQDGDPWGTPYTIEYHDNKFKIISNGPDKKIHTYDDVFKEGYLVNFSESFNSVGNEPLSVTFTISAKEITMGSGTHVNEWV